MISESRPYVSLVRIIDFKNLMSKIAVIKMIFANKNRHKMKTPPPISVRSGLKKLGLALKKARLRRRLPMELVSDRAGISRETLSKIQDGDPGVSMGNYASVIFALGFGTEWMKLADLSNDPVGMAFDEERLPKRARSLAVAKGKSEA